MMDSINIRIWKVITYDDHSPSHVEWYYQIDRDGYPEGPWMSLESAKFDLARGLAGPYSEILAFEDLLAEKSDL